MKRSLLILGAGGHARTVASIASLDERWTLAGVLDRESHTRGEPVGKTSVIGTFADAEGIFAAGTRDVALALGENAEREDWIERLTRMGFDFPVLAHPSSLIEQDAVIGRGTVICAGAILCTEVRVGEAAIVNTGAIIDHESLIGNFSHVAPGCRIAGRVRVGDGAFIGIGSVVRERITIGAKTQVGAGSVVVDDLPPSVIAFGVPARVQRPRA